MQQNEKTLFFGNRKLPGSCHHGGKAIEMVTISGPVSEPICDLDMKIFDDPRRKDCIKEGVWTQREPKCVRSKWSECMCAILY